MGANNWIKVGHGQPELSMQYLVYDPTAVIRFYTAFYSPLPTTEFAGAFTNGGDIYWNVSHFMELPQPPVND